MENVPACPITFTASCDRRLSRQRIKVFPDSAVKISAEYPVADPVQDSESFRDEFMEMFAAAASTGLNREQAVTPQQAVQALFAKGLQVLRV